MARLENGLDAVAAVASHGLAVQHGRRDGPAELAQPGHHGSVISSRPGRLKAWMGAMVQHVKLDPLASIGG